AARGGGARSNARWWFRQRGRAGAAAVDLVGAGTTGERGVGKAARGSDRRASGGPGGGVGCSVASGGALGSFGGDNAAAHVLAAAGGSSNGGSGDRRCGRHGGAPLHALLRKKRPPQWRPSPPPSRTHPR
ncbi:unnamed protein product, partial [Phaeothamnion confervicola]